MPDTKGKKKYKNESRSGNKKGKGPQKPVWPTLARLIAYMGRHKTMAFVSIAAILLSTVVGLLTPWMIRYGIDNLIIGRKPELLWLLGLVMIAVVLVKGLFDFIKRYITEYIAQNVIHDIRTDLYEHLNRLSFSFYDYSRTGDIMSRITSDADRLRQFLANASVYISSNILTIIGIFIVMMVWDYRLGLLYMLMFPLIIVGMIKYATRVRPMFRKVRRKFAGLTGMVQEDFTGIEIIKLFGREKSEQKSFNRMNRQYIGINIKAAKISALWMPYVNFLMGLGTALVIWYGGRLVINNTISLGTLAGFTGYIAILLRPVRQTGMMINFSSQAVAAAERIFEVMDIPPEVRNVPDAFILPSVKGRVEYRDVYFSYSKGKEVLKDINLLAEPGQLVAVVGPTGAGKSTLIHLLPRFYDPDRGSVLIDGYDISKVTVDSLRSQVGIVLQHTFLFAASIRENISYGKPGADINEIIKCAKTAQIHDFISSLPLGYETPVGERGVNLSGGQMQRMAMARVLLTNPRLLILDEPTSSVDTETEERMQKALAEVIKGRTTFVIAHRLWTIKNADKILVIENGSIVENGTHEELVASAGLYSRMFEIHKKEDEEEGADK